MAVNRPGFSTYQITSESKSSDAIRTALIRIYQNHIYQTLSEALEFEFRPRYLEFESLTALAFGINGN